MVGQQRILDSAPGLSCIQLGAGCLACYEDISSWVCRRSPAALRGQGVCLWQSFLGCRNSENFLDRPSSIFASSFESLLSPPAPAEAQRGSRRSQWATVR